MKIINNDSINGQSLDFKAQNIAGLQCAAHGNYSRALVHFKEAIRLNGNFVEAFSNLGNAQNALGDFNGAIISYKEAIKRDRNFFEAYYNLGNCLRQTHNFDEAITCYKAALYVRPESEEALTNLGEALQTIGKVVEAERCYRKIVENSAGKNTLAFSNLLICINYNPVYSPKRLLAEHLAFGKTVSFLTNPAIFNPVRGKTYAKIRLGYVSPDFCMHPVSRFIEPVLRFHDKNAFELFCYSDTIKPDEITENMRRCSGTWKDTAPLSDDQAAELIAQDEIDILVDLSGHTARNRLLVFAKKPAKIQASYLGYPNTTGLSTMDYYLTDESLDEDGDDGFYSEKLIRLEKCFCTFMPYDNAPDVRALPAGQTGSVTFGSLHTLTRLNDRVLDLWSRLLLAVPASRLSIVRNTLVGGVRERLMREFEQRGIARERIDLRNMLPIDGHLGLYHDIDICLDTFPWSGHTTACEALWMGVPVVTLLGERHAGRMASSILRAAGFPDLIARSENEYISRATRLATSIENLAHIREGLRSALKQSDLCDARGFTKRLEKAFKKMFLKK